MKTSKLASRAYSFIKRTLRGLLNGILLFLDYFRKRPTHVKVAMVYLLGICMMIAFFLWNATRFTVSPPAEEQVREEVEEPVEFSFPGEKEQDWETGDGEMDETIPRDSDPRTDESRKNGVPSPPPAEALEEGEKEEEVVAEHDPVLDEGSSETGEGEEESLPVEDAVWPVDERTVLVEFGESLTSKVEGSGQAIEFHRGIDIAVQPGTTVRPVWEGRVISVKEEDLLYGKSLLLEHPGGEKTTFYGNLDSIQVANGEQVQQGDSLGTVEGVSAVDTSLEEPHLHLEIRKDGRPTNPLEYLP